MAAGDVAVEAFQRLLHGQKFPSFRDLDEAISRFSEETGYHFKPVNSHKFIAGSPEAETFVFSSRKYVCVLASTRKRVGCDAFFNIGHCKAGYLAVTSFKAEHGHEPVPVEPQHSKQKSPGSQLTDFRTLRAASPTTQEQTRLLCSLFKKVFQCGTFVSFDGLMSAVKEYEKASSTSFSRTKSERLPATHPRVDALKYRYVYFTCCHSGVFRSCSSKKKTASQKFGCTARFTAVVIGDELHVKALNLRHNHVCSRQMASAYPKLRRLAEQDEKNLLRLMQQMRPSAGRLKAYLKNSKAVDNERLDADEYCRRRHYNGLTPRVSKLCQMLTGYAAEVLLKHVSANGNVKLCSEAVDTCSCRFHRNWQLPCVHIINYIEQNNIEPCRALLKSRWVFRLDVSEMRVTDENVDPEAVTSFQVDILVSKGRGPLTED
nr:unnamed protein product [Spirometra erinaceieuropaei]